MKTAVIGAGAWGKNLVRTLHEMGALSAVAEVSSDIRSALSEKYHDVPLYDNPEALMDNDINTFLIATPAPTHFEVAKKLLSAGKDVFVEKPMTLASSDADELYRIARENDRVLMVGHLLLYQPAVKWLKGEIEKGSIGQLKGIHQSRLGLGRARRQENVLWSLGVHDIAVALYLIGSEPTNVEANGQRILQPAVEDDVHLHMAFPNGVESHLHCSWLWPERKRETVSIGSDGMFVYNELDQTVTLHRKGIDSQLNNQDSGAEVVYKGDGEPLRLELEHFLECVECRKTPISDGKNGCDVVKILELATERIGK